MSKGDWTKSQREFRDIVLAPLDRGVSLCVVRCENSSGLSSLLGKLEKRHARGSEPIIHTCISTTAYSAVLEMAHAANVTGSTVPSFFRNAVMKLTENGQRDLTILFEESHFMSRREMELLIVTIECVARKASLNLRCVFLQRQVIQWVAPESKGANGRKVRAWPGLPDFLRVRENLKSLKIYDFSRAGLEQLRGRQLPSDLYEEFSAVDQHERAPLNERKSA